jgi:DNA invertase Pin-like site-specific DNA recombinase
MQQSPVVKRPSIKGSNMPCWWENSDEDHATKAAQPRAVAYYRHSAQERQENSIPIQREQVREWAKKNGVEIIQEFEDAGKSGLNAEGRPAFNEMMDQWVKQKRDFQYVLCLDVSRFGRFQDIDLSAQYSAECKRHGKQVVYTTIGKPRENDPLYPVYVQFERFRAAQYSKELSDKVWRGCMKIAEQGYWAGGAPPYGLQRLLLDESREPLHVLEPGQRKGIQNQRVTLVVGDPAEVAVIQRIFHEFVELRYSEYRIAEGLNSDGVPSPANQRWSAGMVVERLQNEKYAGTMIYNQTSQKLKTPRQTNASEHWVRTPGAFEGIVSYELFARAQQLFAERRRKYQSDEMLAQLKRLYQQYGLFCSSLLRTLECAPAPATFAHRFGGLDLAFQQLHRDSCDRARELVHDRIRQMIPGVVPYGDFLVLDEKMTLSVQPAMPIPNGYAAYWPFRPDRRHVIDLTLGVLLSDPEELEILGYVALPRLLAGHHTLRINATSLRTELFGRTDLGFLQKLL